MNEIFKNYCARKLHLRKSISLVATTLLVVLTIPDAFSQRFEEIKSEPVYGIRVGIEGSNKLQGFPLAPKDTIIINIIGTNRSSHYIGVPDKDSRFIYVDMIQENGKPVPKTKLGKEIGRKFFDNEPDFDEKKTLRRLPSSRAWHRVQDLFEIDQPGEYSMILHFQFYISVRGKYQFVRFPPISVPVKKEK